MTTQTKVTWRKVKLREVTSKITKGTTPTTLGMNFVPIGINFIKAEAITDDGRFITSKFEHINREVNQKLIRSQLQENDILYSIAGVIGRPAFVTKEMLPANINQALAVIRPDLDKVDPRFIYYLLSSKRQRKYSNNLVAQSAQPNINLEQVSDFEFKIPTLSDQKHIVDILFAFDDKIELNNKISQTLEHMAQAIFKEWFVNSKKYEIKKIGNVAKVVLGGTPSRLKKEYWNGNIPWINSGKVNEFRIISASENITSEGLKKSNTQLMPKRTTVIAITGATLGQVSLLEIEACANQSVVGVFSSKLLSSEFIYLYIKNNILEMIQEAAGGAQQHINKGVVENYPIIMPSKERIEKFDVIIKPFFEKISETIFENQKLSALRDLLLPKLMSGKIRV